ncbi:hypothetical protein ACFL4M_03210 [Pseudomonadota bacterium]
MKLFTPIKWLTLLLCCFLAFGQSSVVWAEVEEEEEEPIQTRPNPMDRSGKMEQKMNTQRNTQMQQRGSKSMTNKMHTGAAGGKTARPGAAMKQQNR